MKSISLNRFISVVVLTVVLVALLMVPEGGDMSYLYAGF